MNIINKTNSLIYNALPPIIKNWGGATIDFLKHGMDSEMWGGGIYSDNLNKAIAQFANSGNDMTTREISKLKKDIVKCYLLYGASPAEYFLLGFQELNHRQRSEFLTDKTKDLICLRTLSLERFRGELTDKYFFYQKNKQFFNRDALVISQQTTTEELYAFLKQHSTLFVKPLDGSLGKGAHILTLATPNTISHNLEELKEGGQRWIAEEVIIQTEEMAKWNTSSINTVRVPSVLVNGKSHIIAPFLRTGRKGSIIDNAGGGGIFAPIDATTGKLITDGFSEDGKYYNCHPDSGLRYKGWQIPRWDELKIITQQAHSNMSDHKYVAFDFALTPSGWVLVEGNWGQFLWQYATKKGIKTEFQQLMEAPL